MHSIIEIKKEASNIQKLLSETKRKELYVERDISEDSVCLPKLKSFEQLLELTIAMRDIAQTNNTSNQFKQIP